jgi:hypothetical protein
MGWSLERAVGSSCLQHSSDDSRVYLHYHNTLDTGWVCYVSACFHSKVDLKGNRETSRREESLNSSVMECFELLYII